MSLVTTEDLIEWMNDPSLQRHDQTLAKLLKRAGKFAERRTVRHLDGLDQKVIRRFGLESPSPRLILPDVILAPSPFTAIDPLLEFRLSVADAFTAHDSLVDLEFFDVDDERGIFTEVTRKNNRFWPCGENLVQATYKTGYDSETIDEDLKEAIMSIAASWWKNRVKTTGTATEQMSRRNAAGRKLAGGAELPAHAETILALWERAENPTANTLSLG